MNENIEISKDNLLCVLWGICLADHMGDVMDSIEDLTKPLGIKGTHHREKLLRIMKEKDLIPEYQRD